MNFTTSTNTSINKVRQICALLPAVTTVGWILGFTLGHIKFFEIVALALIAVGILAALLYSPLKLLLFPLKCVPKGFKLFRAFIPVYGVADLTAALMGTACGFAFGLFVIIGCPAIFTVKKLFDEKKNAFAFEC